MSGSLGLGYDTADSRSQSTSNAYGYSGSESSDVSRSASNAVSGGQSQTNQNIAFEDFYRRLYSGATGAANSVAMQAPELRTAASQLFTGGSQFLQSLGENAGTNYMEDRLNNASPVEDIIAAMRSDSAALFNEELNPAITSRAVAGGMLGGGRQGVAQGVAQAAVNRDFTRQAAELRYADVAAKDSMAANIANNSIAAASTGLGALPGMLDILERGQNAELAPYSNLAAILGGPTALTTSSASDYSRSISQSAADAFSRSFGEQTATSSSSSRGRSRGYDYSGSFSWMDFGGGG